MQKLVKSDTLNKTYNSLYLILKSQVYSNQEKLAVVRIY